MWNDFPSSGSECKRTEANLIEAPALFERVYVYANCKFLNLKFEIKANKIQIKKPHGAYMQAALGYRSAKSVAFDTFTSIAFCESLLATDPSWISNSLTANGSVTVPRRSSSHFLKSFYSDLFLSRSPSVFSVSQFPFAPKKLSVPFTRVPVLLSL